MVDKLSVIVGTGQGGHRALKRALETEGFATLPVSQQWPRDHYVYFDGKYVSRGKWQDGLQNLFGEGGYIRTGNGYVLCGTGLADLVPETKSLSEEEADFNQKLAAACQKYFPAARVHIVESGAYEGRGHNHLDMSVLLIPNNRLLLVDTYFGHLAAHGKEVDCIAEKEKLKVIRYDGSQDGTWYPLNALSLPSEAGDVVFMDSHSKSLANLLEKEGVKYVPVEMPQHTYPAGKINCMTNVLHLSDLTKINTLLENV